MSYWRVRLFGIIAAAVVLLLTAALVWLIDTAFDKMDSAGAPDRRFGRLVRVTRNALLAFAIGMLFLCVIGVLIGTIGAQTAHPVLDALREVFDSDAGLLALLGAGGGASVLIGVASERIRLKNQQRREGKACPGCGYDLAGVTGGRRVICPECGSVVMRPDVEPVSDSERSGS